MASFAVGVIVPESYEFDAAELVMAYGMVAIGLVGAAMAYWAARRLDRQAQATLGSAPEGDLPFAPRHWDGWRTQDDWARFPDPVRGVPRPSIWATPMVPVSEVPPDETLRRLYLVRAHLAMYYATARHTYRFFTVVGGSLS